MTISLVITTYNRPDALEAVLLSVAAQTTLPTEVIIADDGSGSSTFSVIESYKSILSIPLLHAWQEDLGFRAAESRNRAIAMSNSEYIILIDGDMILEKHFIEDHVYYARPNHFLQGGRFLITPSKTSEILLSPIKLFQPSWLEKGVESRFEKKITAFRSYFLTWLLKRIIFSGKKVRSCNMSFYRSDAVKINGFNHLFVGWGGEDCEFVERLVNSGVQGIQIKFSALAYHLHHHEESRGFSPEHDLILNDTITKKATYCDQGLSIFLYH